MASYKRIEEFVNNVFRNAVMNDDLKEQKEELIVNMNDRFNELIESGMDEIDAYRKVVDVFGSLEEIRESLGIIRNEPRRKKKIGFIILTVLIVSILIGSNLYSRQREYLVNDLYSMMDTCNDLRFAAESAENSNSSSFYVHTLIESLAEINKYLIRDMNYFEKRNLDSTQNQFFVNYSIYTMHQILVDKKTYGYWTELDQEVYERYMLLTEELLFAVEKEAHKIQGIHVDGNTRYESDTESFFMKLLSSFDVEVISEYYRQLNELATCYVTYQKLPENISLMSEDEIIESLEEKFGKDIEVRFPQYGMNNVKAVNCTFSLIEIVGDGFSLSTKIDCRDGKIIELFSFTGNREGESVNEVYEVSIVETLVKQVFDETIEYDITYVENSSHLDDDQQNVYAYQVVPEYNGYSVFYKNKNLYPEVYISRVDGQQINQILGYDLNVTIDDIGTSFVVYDEAEAFEDVIKNQYDLLLNSIGEQNYVEGISYRTTGYVYSHLSGKYDLVHIYDLSNTNGLLYINAETGKIE